VRKQGKLSGLVKVLFTEGQCCLWNHSQTQSIFMQPFFLGSLDLQKYDKSPQTYKNWSETMAEL